MTLEMKFAKMLHGKKLSNFESMLKDGSGLF